MAQQNMNAGYGMHVVGAVLGKTTGKSFFVCASSDANKQGINELFTVDSDGIKRTWSTFTEALAQCVAGRGDFVFVSPNYTTAPSAAEILAAETKGVTISPLGEFNGYAYTASRATATLPQTATGALFTVTGRVKLLGIYGEVTTILGATATNAKLIATPTVGSAVDICAAVAVANLAVGTQLGITGTFANAMMATNGAILAQVTPTIIKAGTIGLNTTANNTGSVKWRVEYLPIDPGAKIIAA